MYLAGPSADWWHVDPDNRLVSEPLRRLRDLWQSKHHDGVLPARSDFSAEEFLNFAGRVALIDVEREPLRLRYRLIGTMITEALGRDSTGRYLDELYAPDFYERMQQHFATIADERVALRTHGNMSHSYKPFVAVEGIDMPLAGDGTNVDLILRGLDFNRMTQRVA